MPGTSFSSYNLLFDDIHEVCIREVFGEFQVEAAFLASEESLATAFFRLSITIEELLVLAPTTAIR